MATNPNKPESWRTPEYKKFYSKLDENFKVICRSAFAKWKENPDSIVIKPLNKMFGSNEAVSAELSYKVRAFGYHNAKKNRYVWFWVGSHEDYNGKLTKDYLVTKINAIKIDQEKREQRELDGDLPRAKRSEKQDGEVISISRPNTNSPEMKYMREAFDSSHKGDRKKSSERDKPQKR